MLEMWGWPPRALGAFPAVTHLTQALSTPSCVPKNPTGKIRAPKPKHSCGDPNSLVQRTVLWKIRPLVQDSPISGGLLLEWILRAAPPAGRNDLELNSG